MALTLELYDRAEEIFKKLPKKYAVIILNSIIGNSASNGDLLKEARCFLSDKDYENLKKHFTEKKTYTYSRKKEMLCPSVQRL